MTFKPNTSDDDTDLYYVPDHSVTAASAQVICHILSAVVTDSEDEPEKQPEQLERQFPVILQDLLDLTTQPVATPSVLNINLRPRPPPGLPTLTAPYVYPHPGCTYGALLFPSFTRKSIMSHRPTFPGPENDDRILFWSLIAATAIIVTFLILDDLGRIDIPHGGNLTLPQYLSQEREQ